MLLPNPVTILRYSDVFNKKAPKDRLELIEHIPSTSILAELAGINNILKSRFDEFINYSQKTQVELIERYFRGTYSSIIYSAILRNTSIKPSNKKKNYPIVFTRQGCLLAIEEIIQQKNNSQTYEPHSFSIEDFNRFTEYYLLVNEDLFRPVNESVHSIIENLNASIATLNEDSLTSDIFFTPLRGMLLLNYLNRKSEYSFLIKNYFLQRYGINEQQYILEIINLYSAKISQDKTVDFCYVIQNDPSFLQHLSIHNLKTDIHKHLNIRKSPFLSTNNENNNFILLDNTSLLNKAYNMLINELWFDLLKHKTNNTSKKPFNITSYKGHIGRFFEVYTSQIFADCFNNHKHITLLTSNELNIKSNKGEIEFCDILLKSRNRVMIIECKSTQIYDNEKYSGSAEELYKHNRSQFFKDHGVDQIADSIINLNTINQLKSIEIDVRKTIVYPIIVVNDPIFMTPFMNNIFNERLKEILDEKLNTEPKVIYNLWVVHINQLERIWPTIKESPNRIWNILKYKSVFAHHFFPPFSTRIQHLNRKKEKPDLILNLYTKVLNVEETGSHPT